MKTEHDIEQINRFNFRSSLEALSRPGEKQKVLPLFDSGLLAMASVFLYAEVTHFYAGKLDFELIQALTGSASASCRHADYLFFESPGPEQIEQAKIGSAENPEQGATLVYGLPDHPEHRIHVLAEGPGIKEPRKITLPADELFVQRLRDKNEHFPLGVDLFFVFANNQLLGLPRTTRIEAIS